MKKISFILASFFLLSGFKSGAHEFYLSVTEITYKKETQSLQVITRIFADDFEEVLRTRFDDEIRLIPDGEKGPVSEMTKKYLDQKLQIRVGEEPLQLNYLGKEYDADQVVLYIEIEDVPHFNEIEVTNAILTDLFDDQKNVVHVQVDGVTKSMLLQKDNDSESLIFKN